MSEYEAVAMNLRMLAIVTMILGGISCTLAAKKDPSCISSDVDHTYHSQNQCPMSGHVRDCAGAALVDVKVTATRSDGTASVCTYSMADGRWQLLLDVDGIPYTVRIEKQDYGAVIRRYVDPKKWPTCDTTLSTRKDDCGNWTD